MPTQPGEINVRDKGAIGDGNPANAAQDTSGFLSAILVARNTPGTAVYVPPGKYFINETLTLSNQTLRGDPMPAWGADSPHHANNCSQDGGDAAGGRVGWRRCRGRSLL